MQDTIEQIFLVFNGTNCRTVEMTRDEVIKIYGVGAMLLGHTKHEGDFISIVEKCRENLQAYGCKDSHLIREYVLNAPRYLKVDMPRYR